MHTEGGNPRHSEEYGENKILLANILLHQGRVAEAETLLDEAYILFNDLVTHDPENAIWLGDRAISALHLAEIGVFGAAGENYGERLDEALSDLTTLVDAEPSDTRLITYLALAERLAALVQLGAGASEAAVDMSRRAYERMRIAMAEQDIKTKTAQGFGIVAEAHGRVLRSDGQADLAASVWIAALDALTSQPTRELPQLAIEMRLAEHLGRERVTEDRNQQLLAAGFADPRFR